MPTIETTVAIARKPQTIAEAFLNPDNAVYWTTDLERFEVISREPGEVGSIAHLHYVQNDRRYVLEDVLEEMIPNQYFKSRVTGGGITAQVETWLREQNGSTLVKLRWSGSGTALLTRLLLPFMRGSIAKQTKRELETFRDLVEKFGSDFSKAGSSETNSETTSSA